MGKYIDAELLKAKLDEHYRKYQSKYMETRNPYTQGLIDALDLAEQIIDYLQHEQQDFPTTDEQIKEFLATHPKIKVPEKYKNPDWLFKKQEKPEVDLEKEIEEYFDRWSDDSEYGQAVMHDGACAGVDECKDIARHFAKWGAEHLKK